MAGDRAGGPMAQPAALMQEAPGHTVSSGLIKTKAQIEGIRKAGRLNAEILDMLAERIAEGLCVSLRRQTYAHRFSLLLSSSSNLSASAYIYYIADSLPVEAE